MDNNKKFLLIGGGVFVVIIIILIVVLTSGSKKEKVQTGPKTLTIWNMMDEKSAFEDIVDSFKDVYPDVEIKYEKKEPGNYSTEALNEIASGRGPDIWAIPNDWIPQYHDKLVPMPEGTLFNKKLKKK